MNQMEFMVGFDSAYIIDLYFHNRDLLFFPNRNNGYGSARIAYDTSEYLAAENDTSQQTYFTRLHFDQVEERSLNKARERCNASMARPAEEESVSRCVARHIEGKVGCRYGHYGKRP